MKNFCTLLMIGFVLLASCKKSDEIEKDAAIQEDLEDEDFVFTLDKVLSDNNSKDATVTYWYPSKDGGLDDTTNQGKITFLSVMNWIPYKDPDLSARARTFIQFDLTEIPEGSTVKSASLTMYGVRDQGMIGDEGWKNEGWHFYGNIPNVFSYYQVFSSWDERTISWANMPLVSDSAGGQYGPTEKIYEDIVLDVKDLAQLWVNDPSSNHGIYLKLNKEESNQRIIVQSTESRFGPRIVVKYE